MLKVSIITATYNSGKTILDTLESVARQGYPAIEHLIVDGLSTDDTIDKVRRFNSSLRVHSGKDDGIYDAMNKGIGHAGGDIVGILNSDDVYAHDDVIAHVVDLFKDPAVGAVYSDLQYVDAQNLNKVVRHWRSGDYRVKKFFFGWMPPHPTFFVRRELYEKFGVFNTKFRTAADYELMLRFLLKHGVQAAYLPEVTVKMRVGGLSNSSFRHRIKANREDRLAWNQNSIKPFFFTLYLKPVRKIGQYFSKG